MHTATATLCEPGQPAGGPSSVAVLSIYTDCRAEADRFKWIESEKAGRDLGEGAIKRWVQDHWWGYLRARWLEHRARSLLERARPVLRPLWLERVWPLRLLGLSGLVGVAGLLCLPRA